jgi:hypothetical protein
MIQNLQPAMDADQDLHIATHIEPATLPAIIQYDCRRDRW